MRRMSNQDLHSTLAAMAAIAVLLFLAILCFGCGSLDMTPLERKEREAQAALVAKATGGKVEDCVHPGGRLTASSCIVTAGDCRMILECSDSCIVEHVFCGGAPWRSSSP